MAQRKTKPRGTRMWAVVTRRGKVLQVAATKAEAADGCHYELEHEGARLARVIVTVEG